MTMTPTLFLLILSWSGLLYLIQIVYLSTLLLSKLSALYDHYNALPFSVSRNGPLSRKTHDHLVLRVTRTVVLYFVSLIASAFTVGTITYILVHNAQRHRIELEFVMHFVVLMDIFGNFVCVLLSYDYYKTYYFKAYSCGLLHGQCARCMTACARKSVEKPPRKSMDSVSFASNIALHLEWDTFTFSLLVSR